MTTLEERVWRLEKRGALTRAMYAHAVRCDDGPYGLEVLDDWTADPFLDSGSATFSGRENLARFYESLPASFVIHYFTNLVVELDPSGTSATVHCYGFEAATIRGRPEVGAFTDRFVAMNSAGRWTWHHWEQVVHLDGPLHRNGQAVLKDIAQEAQRRGDT